MRQLQRTMLAFEQHEDADIIRITGDVDITCKPQLNGLLQSLEGARRAIVDLSECTYMDSTMLNALYAVNRLRGATLWVVLPTDANARRVIHLTNLDERLRIAPSVSTVLGHI